jgi:hypothetical protein
VGGKKMPNFIDLTGQTFGRLTVISIANSQKRRVFWKCRCVCGNVCEKAASSLRKGHVKSCGCLHRETLISRNVANKGICSSTPIEERPQWKGGRVKTGKGYMLVDVRVFYPELMKYYPGRRYLPEHVAVIVKKLGRPLFAGENVHHKNGVRDDNRPENLELWVSSQPSGQRVEDLVMWAKQVLARYDK